MSNYSMEKILNDAQQLKADEIFIKIGQIPALLVKHYKNEIVSLRNSQGLVNTINQDEYLRFINEIKKIAGIESFKELFECNISLVNGGIFRIKTSIDDKGHEIMVAKRFSH